MKNILFLSALFFAQALGKAATTRHFYSTDPNGEYAASVGFGQRITVGEGIREALPGTTVLYRCRAVQANAYLLTTDPNCEGAGGYQLEGGVTNIFTSQVAGSAPLYRFVNNLGDHLYTLQPQGLGCDTGNYVQEGITGYLRGNSNQGTGITLYGFRLGCNSDHDPCCN